MRIPLWLLLRRGGLRGKAPYVSNLLSGGDIVAAPPPAGATKKGFPPAPLQEGPPGSIREAASRVWVARTVEVVNDLRRGKMNVVLPTTLKANSTITTVIDNRIGILSSILFSPITANAAAEMAAGTLYVSSQTEGSAVLTHADNAQTDRTFNLVVLG